MGGGGGCDGGCGGASIRDRMAAMLACPDCRADLDLEPACMTCRGCGARFGFHDGVALFAKKGSAETWIAREGGPSSRRLLQEEDDAKGAPTVPPDGRGDERAEGATSRAYQENYEQLARAAEYNQKYRRERFKRLTTRRESRILRRLLGLEPRSSTLLDLPCGGGRLSAQIAPAADLLVEADIALGQVLYGRQNVVDGVPRFWMTASAFHIPLQDASIDGAVCIRLCHHLPTEEERERLVRELLRVTRRFVIMTFFDYSSPKNILRRARRAFGIDDKRPKNAMTVARVAALAREGGAELVACPYLAFIGSGHRYALMEKRPS